MSHFVHVRGTPEELDKISEGITQHAEYKRLAKGIDGPYPETVWDFIDDHGDSEMKSIRFVLMLLSLPDHMLSRYREMIDVYELYCQYAGQTWRVVGVSKDGNIGLSPELHTTLGQRYMVPYKSCSDWLVVSNSDSWSDFDEEVALCHQAKRVLKKRLHHSLLVHGPATDQVGEITDKLQSVKKYIKEVRALNKCGMSKKERLKHSMETSPALSRLAALLAKRWG